MIYSPPHYDDPRHPSIYDALTGWASHARPRRLAGIAAGGIAILAVLALIDWRHVPVAGFLLTGSAVACWGLVEQRATTPHSTSIRVLQALLMVVGTLAAVVGGFALLFWVMGPAPVL